MIENLVTWIYTIASSVKFSNRAESRTEEKTIFILMTIIFAELHEVPPYEEMALYYPHPNQKRPLILVGPPSIGRHELRQRLLDDTTKFAAPVPRT